ncbi:hypothetical protein [Microlunatus elymi]|nr:hypothetical protein [Microlunatus elymi]
MIDGLPYWIPPRWIDHDQKPRLNYRIRIRHHLDNQAPPALTGARGS